MTIASDHGGLGNHDDDSNSIVSFHSATKQIAFGAVSNAYGYNVSYTDIF